MYNVSICKYVQNSKLMENFNEKLIGIKLDALDVRVKYQNRRTCDVNLIDFLNKEVPCKSLTGLLSVATPGL